MSGLSAFAADWDSLWMIGVGVRMTGVGPEKSFPVMRESVAISSANSVK